MQAFSVSSILSILFESVIEMWVTSFKPQEKRERSASDELRNQGYPSRRRPSTPSMTSAQPDPVVTETPDHDKTTVELGSQLASLSTDPY